MQTEGCNFRILGAALHTSLGDCSPAAGNSVFSNTHRRKTTHSAFKLKLTETVLIQSFPFLLIFLKKNHTHFDSGNVNSFFMSAPLKLWLATA